MWQKPLGTGQKLNTKLSNLFSWDHKILFWISVSLFGGRLTLKYKVVCDLVKWINTVLCEDSAVQRLEVLILEPDFLVSSPDSAIFTE